MRPITGKMTAIRKFPMRRDPLSSSCEVLRRIRIPECGTKGTFVGLAEKDPPYLKELGVNQLLLMPVYDFDERILPEKEKNLPYQKRAGTETQLLGLWESPVFRSEKHLPVKDPVKGV